MEKPKRKFYIRLQQTGLIEVSQEVYNAYYNMRREEKYQMERDLKHGVLYYDGWDTEDTNGEEYLADRTANTEKEALDHIMQQEFWDQTGLTSEQSKLLRLIAAGKTECEIAEILGISQSTVNRNKNRMYRRLKKILR